MNQSPMGTASRFQLDIKAKLSPLSTQLRPLATVDTRLRRKVAEGLQLTRASTIALTRLQLALAGGDRRQAMAAIDRLHVLDGEIELLVEQLPQSTASAASDEQHTATVDLPAIGEPLGEDLLASLSKHLTDQKLALAFEKLALASGISGPDLVSTDSLLPLSEDVTVSSRAEHQQQTDAAADDNRGMPATASEKPLVDWHAFPDVQTVVWERIPAKVWGILLTMLVAAALIAAIVLMTLI